MDIKRNKHLETLEMHRQTHTHRHGHTRAHHYYWPLKVESFFFYLQTKT